MRLELRNTTRAGNNVSTELFINGENKTPSGIHVNREEYDVLKNVMDAGVAMLDVHDQTMVGPIHTFEAAE